MKRYPFTRPIIEYAPYDVGGTHNIRACLLEHLDGRRGDCTRTATHYSWEITIWDSARETELLALFARENRRDPRCQQKLA